MKFLIYFASIVILLNVDIYSQSVDTGSIQEEILRVIKKWKVKSFAGPHLKRKVRAKIWQKIENYKEECEENDGTFRLVNLFYEETFAVEAEKMKVFKVSAHVECQLP